MTTKTTTRTATHNGTCQACGNTQAVNSQTGLLAKHGYTVNWGFFNGTCRGSDHLPLQQDTATLESTVAALIAHAEKAEAMADGEITKVPCTYTERHPLTGRRIKRTVRLDAEAYAAHPSTYGLFEHAVNEYRRWLRHEASHARQRAAELVALRDKVHGQPLMPRAVELPIHRESYDSYREAALRVAALKERGIDARQRREQWSRHYTVTYRHASKQEA